MNQEPKLKRPEDVDAIYTQLEDECPSLSMVINEVKNYLNPADMSEHYGTVLDKSFQGALRKGIFCTHAFNFLWLILCIERYES